MIKQQKAHHEYLSIWFYLLFSSTLVNLAVSIYKSDPINVVFRNIGFGTISSAISIIGIIMVVPYYEKKWNRATKQTLLELLDFNHPLLKKLATSAVGTYHHSLIVGNLAERAAEAINANPLLARVGSYYHDIGKIINTEIFTENNADSAEIHDVMMPDKSASLIKNHVLEGITLAKKYKIPQPVIDVIMQHHGDSVIRYFYDRAGKLNLPTQMTDYQYPGPRPQSKEAALVMIADIVESTTKAKTITNESDIEKIIDDTISRLIREGQFDEAPITMRDLFKIKQSMLPVLGSIYRKRLDYPDENDKS
jgi:putative nucleotidyltransferase with HDIG domain